MTEKTWTIPVDDDGMLTFPEDLVELMGWDEGTILSWDVRDDGCVYLTKAPDDSETPEPPEECKSNGDSHPG